MARGSKGLLTTLLELRQVGITKLSCSAIAFMKLVVRFQYNYSFHVVSKWIEHNTSAPI